MDLLLLTCHRIKKHGPSKAIRYILSIFANFVNKKVPFHYDKHPSSQLPVVRQSCWNCLRGGAPTSVFSRFGREWFLVSQLEKVTPDKNFCQRKKFSAPQNPTLQLRRNFPYFMIKKYDQEIGGSLGQVYKVERGLCREKKIDTFQKFSFFFWRISTYRTVLVDWFASLELPFIVFYLCI